MERTPCNVKTKSDKVVKKLKILIGSQVSHALPPLSAYLTEAMKNNTRYFPFTIFETNWLLNNLAYMQTKKVRLTCAMTTTTYKGLKVPNEFWQDFARCTRTFDTAIRYYCVVFKQEELAARLEIHKSNMLKIQQKHHDVWMPAMQYNLYHQRNVWNNWLEDGTMSDVATINKDLVKSAKQDAERFGEMIFSNNPYILPQRQKKNVSLAIFTSVKNTGVFHTPVKDQANSLKINIKR